MRIDTGSYTGDGAGGGQNISLTNCSGDLSSVASFVLVMPADSGAAPGAPVWTTDNFTTGYARRMWGQVDDETGLISGLTTAQFTVDGYLNTSGKAYNYLVCQDDGTSTDIETGSYTGNGSDDQDGLLTYGAWTPDAVLVGSDGGFEYNIGRFAADANSQYFFNTAESATLIKSVNSGYCRLSNDNNVNQSGQSFQFVVFGKVSGYVDFLEYAGNSTDDRTVATTGNFTPDFSFVLHSHADDIYGKEISTDNTDTSTKFSNGFPAANHIQDFVATGIEVGNDADVNGTGNDYFLWAFKQYAGASGSSVVPIFSNQNVQKRIITNNTLLRR